MRSKAFEVGRSKTLEENQPGRGEPEPPSKNLGIRRDRRLDKRGEKKPVRDCPLLTDSLVSKRKRRT